MGNPFDLPGPQFLVFYFGLGLIVCGLLYYLRSTSESGPVAGIDASDPYLIAYLRGGKKEAARVATISLVDRGLLRDDGATRLAATKSAVYARRPIEKAIVKHFGAPGEAQDVFTNPLIDGACEEYRTSLSRRGFLPDAATRRARRTRLTLALLVIVGVAATKVVVALARGRPNVLFLLILATLFAFVAVKLVTPHRTVRGSALLNDLRRLFSQLRDRAPSLQSGGATSEAALVAALFGIAVLPYDRFPFARRLYPRARHLSLSCGTACGSGCGGGGCGGGS